jgi:hypothetical protein
MEESERTKRLEVLGNLTEQDQKVENRKDNDLEYRSVEEGLTTDTTDFTETKADFKRGSAQEEDGEGQAAQTN